MKYIALIISLIINFSYAELVKLPNGGSVQLLSNGSDIMALHYKMDKDWHIFWQHPGSVGKATSVAITQNEQQFNDIQILWPAPKKYDLLGFDIWGYGKEATLLFNVPQQLNTNEPFSSKIDGQICKDICIPYSVELNNAKLDKKLIDKTLKNLPVDITEHKVEAKLIYSDDSQDMGTFFFELDESFQQPQVFIAGIDSLMYNILEPVRNGNKNIARVKVSSGLSLVENIEEIPLHITIVDKKKSYIMNDVKIVIKSNYKP